jgi:BirA family biotin operon repressor/biotin-[acetyl-CoA-carboxylase] ligase
MEAGITLGYPLIRLDQVDSTNTYASQLIKSGRAKEGTVILADFQTEGRGQKGNRWESEKGMNLTFSIILLPVTLEAHKQFYLLMSISLGIHFALKKYEIDSGIKWPNDIYAGHKKIGGILIENSVMGNHLSSSVVGIGLNVNQTSFLLSDNRPTSLRFELKREIDRDKLFTDCLVSLNEWIDNLYMQQYPLIKEIYLNHLLQYNQWTECTGPKCVFKGRITDIQESGELVVEDQQGDKGIYRFKEIEYRI